jgi:hypothetical protein
MTYNFYLEYFYMVHLNKIQNKKTPNCAVTFTLQQFVCMINEQQDQWDMQTSKDSIWKMCIAEYTSSTAFPHFKHCHVYEITGFNSLCIY